MKSTLRFLAQFFRESFGMLSLGSLLLVLLSGLMLLVPFDVASPYESVRQMMLTNGFAAFSRNLHYWSGQFFLIFTILHTWEYLYRPQDIPGKRGMWLRLVVSLLVSVLVMLTGFILKGDADSLQARRIMESLFDAIPLAGNFLSSFLLGKEGSFQLIYVHHLATATIFLLIVLFEHARTIWVKSRLFVYLSAILILVSLLFRAPLHDNLNPVVKGPWYLVGLQEILHLMGSPGWIWLIVLILLGTLYYLPVLKNGWLVYGRRLLEFSFLLYALLSMTAYFFRGSHWEWIWPWESGYRTTIYFPFRLDTPPFHPGTAELEALSNSNKKESCKACHSGMTGFSPSHDPEALGCFACHRGDPYSMNRKQAHRGMILSPGNMEDAALSCGTTGCHPDIIPRVDKTIMQTASGMVSVDRFVFGESNSPSVLSNIREIGSSPADVHLRNLCAHCHLGHPKTTTGPVHQGSRGGGCLACHLDYPPRALAEHLRLQDQTEKDSLLPRVHPILSIGISNDHCFGCHSRSGRIATSYEGWHETLLEAGNLPPDNHYRVLDDQRVYEYREEDVHHAAGLECTDCHTSYGLMGDGTAYLHKEQQVKIHCEDCHLEYEPSSLRFEELDPESSKIAVLRKTDQPGRRFLAGQQPGVVLLNSIQNGEKWELFEKRTGVRHPLNPPAGICTEGNAHRDLSCSACHAGWAPRCIGCHNQFDPDAAGYDLLRDRDRKGSWTEFVGLHLAGPPTLGVREAQGNEERTILPATPGMVLSIDRSSFTGAGEEVLFKRLFAPIDPHTTQTKGRSCRSCHNDPVALGYGEGKLEYTIRNGRGHWVFHPRFGKNKYDGLPEDAWTGFGEEREGIPSTRENFRPFSTAEQHTILTVGACLECHPEDSPLMRQSLGNFGDLVAKRPSSCILPDWEKK